MSMQSKHAGNHVAGIRGIAVGPMSFVRAT